MFIFSSICLIYHISSLAGFCPIQLRSVLNDNAPHVVGVALQILKTVVEKLRSSEMQRLSLERALKAAKRELAEAQKGGQTRRKKISTVSSDDDDESADDRSWNVSVGFLQSGISEH